VTFDDQIRTALDGTTASLREHLEAQLRAFAQEAARVAAEERQRAVEEQQQAVKAASETVAAEVRAQAEVLVADVRSQAEAQVGQIRAAAQKHAEELKRAAEAQIGELRKALEELRAQAQQQLDAARRIAQAEIEKAHAEIEKARADADTNVEKARADADKEIEKARADADKEIEKARADAGTNIDEARADADKAKAEVESARAETDLARAETAAVREQAKQEIASAQGEIDTNRQAAAAEAEEVLIARLTAAHTISERKTAEAVDRAHTDSHQSELSRAARLADAIRNLDEARGLSEVLERLVQCSGHEVDRAAVLLVKGERLTGWRLAGFAPGGPSAKSIDLGVEEAGLAGAVLTSGVPASRPSDAADGPGLPPFAGNAGDRHAMALPVRVGGEVVAVLYADAPRVNEPSSDARWPAILEVLARHASRVLEAMTVQQAAGLSLPRPMARGSHTAVPGPVEQAGKGDEEAARRYARLLLSEIRMYHEPIVDAGRRSGDLMSRLQGEIERARKLYEARVPESVQARAEYFDQELVRTLAGGDRTLLGSAQ
jgi:chemotaxis protein histidine kinase CheA